MLDFKRLEGDHSGQSLATTLLAVLDDMEITSKLFCVTTDAASNNTKMMEYVEEQMYERGLTHWNAKERHIYCIDHALNLAVQVFLRSIKGLHPESDSDNDDGSDEVADDDGGFQQTLQKLRKIVKVYPDSLPIPL